MKRIVHLGLGNFHRAHQAWYTAQTSDWNITGVVMSNRDLHDQLAENENTYLLGIWDSDGLRREKISVYDSVHLASEEQEAVISCIADSRTHVVTLTVTEKGYHLRAQDDRLDLSAPKIAADMNTQRPRSAIGLLAEGLIRRTLSGAGAFTILSCDNLADNGRKLRQALIDYLEVRKPNTVDWLLQNTTFPNSMVDRITPRLTETAVTEILAGSGLPGMPVVGTEDFTEWVIEDNFASHRPDWDSAGALFVTDVASFEDRKLRLLNASHSYLAYAGLLAGHRYVHEAIADPVLLRGVNALWDEAETTVPAPAADTITAYREALLKRFSVPAMRHELKQIAADGSLKLRERLIPILRQRAASGQKSLQVETAIQCWIGFVRHQILSGHSVDDPNAEKIGRIIEDDDHDPTQNTALLKLIGYPGS